MSVRLSAWAALSEARLVDGELPGAEDSATPWYISALLGLCAWVAAVLLAVAMAIALPDLFEVEGLRLAVGIACCGGALALLFKSRASVFASQLALAASLAGQAIVAWAVIEMLDNGRNEVTGAAIVLSVLACAMCIAPSALHRFACIVIAATWGGIALYYTALGGLWPGLLALLLVGAAVADEIWPRAGALLAPARVALAVTLVGWIVAQRMNPAAAMGAPLAMILAVTLGLGAWRTAVGLRLSAARQCAVIAVAGLVALVLHASPGILAGLLIALVGRAVGNRMLTGLGVLALLAAVSDYYYWMGDDLLAKSGHLAVAGAVLLAAGALLLWKVRWLRRKARA